jgi:hypothetical protein
MSNRPTGTCPVCNGTLRQPIDAVNAESHKRWNKSYDAETQTIHCQNCIPKGMFASSIPTGIVPLNKDGEPCKHRYEEMTIGRCYYKYTCMYCGDGYTIDSGD